MNKINPKVIFNRPEAIAIVKGSPNYPDIFGKVSFYNACCGTLVLAEICGLPCENSILAMHIHNGDACTGNQTDYFANAGSHLNPNNAEHPYHMGDLPSLINNNGYAWSLVYTNRFKPCEVKGYPVIIHKNPDDYHTQPSGNSGEKIACGMIL